MTRLKSQVVGSTGSSATKALLLDVLAVLADEPGSHVEVPEQTRETEDIGDCDPGLPTLCFFYVWHLLWEVTRAFKDDAWKPSDASSRTNDRPDDAPQPPGGTRCARRGAARPPLVEVSGERRSELAGGVRREQIQRRMTTDFKIVFRAVARGRVASACDFVAALG